jgi:membrane-bound serine protease (ClpP class)
VPSGGAWARLVAAAVLVVGGLVALLPAAGAQESAQESGGRRGIAVVQIEGLLDPPTVTLVEEALRDANRARRTMLVIQIDSRGAVDVDVDALVRRIERSRIPVVAWAGPPGGRAEGGALLVLQAAHRAYVANGASVGPGAPVDLGDPEAIPAGAVATELARLAEANGRDPDAAARSARRSFTAAQAEAAGLVDRVRPTLGEVVVTMDGETVETAAGSITVETARVVGEGRDRRREPNQEVVFDGMGLGGQTQHSLIRPSVAYFLLVAGLALIAFEFFAISIGLVGMAGAIAVVGATYGFSHLPTRWWAVALLVAGVVGLAVDVQAGGVGFWTGFGTVALVVGTLFLYGGSPRLDVAWWVAVLVVGGAVLFFLWGMTAAVRARFSTPTIGREGMVGRMGTAEVPIAPDGVAMIDGARWLARTNRATPIAAGDPVRVIEVAGLVLEVEPETGGAKDHREEYRERKRLAQAAKEAAARGDADAATDPDDGPDGPPDDGPDGPPDDGRDGPPGPG